MYYKYPEFSVPKKIMHHWDTIRKMTMKKERRKKRTLLDMGINIPMRKKKKKNKHHYSNNSTQNIRNFQMIRGSAE